MTTRTVILNGRFSGTLQPTGTQIVTFYLFDAIIRANRDFDLLIFADPAFPGVDQWSTVPRTRLIEVPFSRWSRMKAQMWEQFVLPGRVKRHRGSLVHHPLMTCPRWSLGVPTIVTLHDLNFYHHPEWFSVSFRRWMMHTAVPGVHQATHVVAISDYVLADLQATLGLPAQKTSRIYNGLKSSPIKGAPSTRLPFVILGVNLWQPHKNLSRLIEAFQILRQEFPSLELHLAGRPQAQFREQPELKASLQKPGISILGYLSEQDLHQAYSTATVFCYPSLAEGFGLPVLEAMSLGAPVVTSNVSCLPEIAGGAAILVNPLDPAALARGLREALLENESERANRVEKGKAVARQFTWEKAANEYISLYRQIMAIT